MLVFGMPALPPKQLHVLTHLERVVEKLPIYERERVSRRYELDGVECTLQITGLIVRKCVLARANGQLVRLYLPRGSH